MKKVLVFLLFLAASLSASAFADERIKDLVNIRGVRSNDLIGYGLVVGLNGTGDSKATPTTGKAAANMLGIMGMKINEKDMPTKNMASVIVTAELPPFARNGDRLDVRVSAIGDAKSLAGGTLLLTPLKGADGQMYAQSQGVLTFGAQTPSLATSLTVARISQGASVEKEFIPYFAHDGSITLSLKTSDFTNASRITDAINDHFRGFFAGAVDSSSIVVILPPSFQDNPVDFVSQLEAIKVKVDTKAIVVFNEKTGTLVMGDEVIIKPVTIAHGDISIKIAPDGPGKDKNKVTVKDLLESLNKLGLEPKDYISIFQSLKASGALSADVKFL